MFGVYSLSTTAEITFILPKLYLKKIDKKAITLFRLCLLLYVKNWATVHHCFFHLSFPKVLHKSVLLSIIKVPYKSAILSIITCHHLSYPNVLCKRILLSSKNVALSNLTSLIIPKSVFQVCSIKLNFR